MNVAGRPKKKNWRVLILDYQITQLYIVLSFTPKRILCGFSADRYVWCLLTELPYTQSVLYAQTVL